MVIQGRTQLRRDSSHFLVVVQLLIMKLLSCLGHVLSEGSLSDRVWM
jgi:hypothetical protein